MTIGFILTDLLNNDGGYMIMDSREKHHYVHFNGKDETIKLTTLKANKLIKYAEKTEYIWQNGGGAFKYHF